MTINQNIKTILVTGSAGFIGFHTSQKLLASGYKVIGLDNLNNYYDPKLKKARNAILRKNPNYLFYKIDLGDYRQLVKIFKKHPFDQICHLGAQAGVRYSLQNPFVYLKSNVDGTLNLLELCHQYNIKEFVYASSSSVYGNNKKIPFSEKDVVDHPISLYAATKKSDELIAHVYHKLYKINCIGLRFFTVYGPWGRPDMALFDFTKKILNNEEIPVFNFGNMERDFTYVEDIVAGILAALNNVNRVGYEIINLGNNKPEKLTKFINTLEKHLGKKAKQKLLPIQPGDVPKTYADISKAKKLLGYKPKTNINTGIKRFVEWYLDYYN